MASLPLLTLDYSYIYIIFACNAVCIIHIRTALIISLQYLMLCRFLRRAADITCHNIDIDSAIDATTSHDAAFSLPARRRASR